MTGHAVACTTLQTVLGEGARWDARRDEMLGVDILAGHVYRERIDEHGNLIRIRSYYVPGTVGAIAPVANDEDWLLAELFVTTATEGWSDEQRRAEPTAGLVYRFDTDAVSRPAAPFRPDPGWWKTVRS